MVKPQRDIEREREGGRWRERKRERVRKRERERRKGRWKENMNMEKYNVSNKGAQEARYHDAANDMCYLILILLW